MALATEITICCGALRRESRSEPPRSGVANRSATQLVIVAALDGTLADMPFRTSIQSAVSPPPRREQEDARQFRELVTACIDQVVDADGSGDPEFKRFRRKVMNLIAGQTVRAIAQATQSHIETTLVRALVLEFLKTDGLGIFVHPTTWDTRQEIADVRRRLADSRDLQSWFRDYRPKDGLQRLLDEEHASDRLPLGEWRGLSALVARYHSTLDASYHMTLQPHFPDIKIAEKSIRPDMYFWIPIHPNVNVIVECDGYKYHSNREKFERDRKRDRALQALGYNVFRFSGSEINQDPHSAADELARFLIKRAAVADAAHAEVQDRLARDHPKTQNGRRSEVPEPRP